MKLPKIVKLKDALSNAEYTVLKVDTPGNQYDISDKTMLYCYKGGPAGPRLWLKMSGVTVVEWENEKFTPGLKPKTSKKKGKLFSFGRLS